MGSYNKKDVLFPPLPSRIKVEFSRPFWNLIGITRYYLTPSLDRKLFLEFKKIYPDHDITFIDSATSGIYLILKGLNVSKNDEIIIPSFVCKSVINAIIESGATPVFADVGDDFNITIDYITKKISSRTKAVIAVHQYGKLCPIVEIKKLCQKHHITLIEDSAIPVGVQRDLGRQFSFGSFGDYSVLSFNIGKTIVSFGGGIILSRRGLTKNHASVFAKKNNTATNNTGMLKKFLYFLTNIYYKRFFSIPFRLMQSVGLVHREENIERLYEISNKRPIEINPVSMSRLQKATTLYQVKNLPLIIKNQKRIAGIYTDLLKDIDEIGLPDPKFNQYTYYPILSKDRYDLAVFLSERGIETQWTFFPLHLQSKYAKYHKVSRADSLKNTNMLWRRELSLPIGPMLSEDKARFVANQIIRFYALKNKKS